MVHDNKDGLPNLQAHCLPHVTPAPCRYLAYLAWLKALYLLRHSHVICLRTGKPGRAPASEEGVQMRVA